MNQHNPKVFYIRDCITIAEDLGYKEKFTISSRGILRENNRYVYSPEEVKIQSHYHYKLTPAHSIPSVFYLLETSDGKRGFLAEDENEVSENRIRNFVRQANYHDGYRTASVGWVTRVQTFLRSLGNRNIS